MTHDAPPPSAGWTAALSDYITKKKNSHNNRLKTLTFHPVIDDFLSLFGRTLSEPVVTQQHCDLVGVHQLPRDEGQRAKWHLFIARWTEKEHTREKRVKRSRWWNVDVESRTKRRNKTFSEWFKNTYMYIYGQLLGSKECVPSCVF